MSSLRTVNILNQTATCMRTSPRKRARIEAEHPPSSEIQDHAKATVRKSLGRASRKSVSQLPTPKTRSFRLSNLSNDITLHPITSPRANKSRENGARSKLPKGRKRILQRGKIVNESPFKGQDVVVDVNAAKVDFNSFNTPAKQPRKRNPNPLHILKTLPIEHVRRSGAVNEDERANGPPSTRSPRQPSHEPLSDEEQDEPDNIYEPEHVTHPSQDSPPHRSRLPASGRRASEEMERMNSPRATQQEKPRNRQRDRSIPTEVHSPVRESGKARSSEKSKNAEPNKPGKKRKPLTEDELRRGEQRKLEQKQAEQKQREGNVEDTGEAAIVEFDEWKERFGQGIEVQAEEAGGLETWKILGAAALKIKDVSRKEPHEATDRADGVWDHLVYLQNEYMQLYKRGDRRRNEEAITEAINRLTEKSTLQHLRPVGFMGQSGDQTVVNVYQAIIPRVVAVLKLILLSRYLDGFSPEAIDEIISLVNIGLSLCTVAMEWTPRPSSMPAGILQTVHNHVNPSLRSIKICLEEKQRYEEHRVRQQQIQERLRLAQKASRESKAKRWADVKQRLTSKKLHHSSSSQQSRRKDMDVVDIDDID